MHSRTKHATFGMKEWLKQRYEQVFQIRRVDLPTQ